MEREVIEQIERIFAAPCLARRVDPNTAPRHMRYVPMGTQGDGGFVYVSVTPTPTAARICKPEGFDPLCSTKTRSRPAKGGFSCLLMLRY